ncbi:hypothetical protein CO2235_MP80321 [Cupriavidus oxalaticus]|uniref:Transposase TnpC homeodomain domain-containing protein n=1 Tax=Cupriavidus oxalaticus TaxID=96344 RepID=A0A375GJC6_9BURK|nr:hypothetical protein CO2235_U770169 [Cupriavidus oxalaticus]SPC24441.1 hypothetical protein CO2235_MP80321 [Cupriavidus oxalaticus]
MNEHDLSQLPPAAQAYIRELEARAAANAQHIAELNERIKLLEEQFRLAQSKRFAPSSEKLKDRVFDEAEQMATAEPADDDEMTRSRRRTRGCRSLTSLQAANVVASRCQRTCRASESSTT